ncbi:MAG: hypothetical protein HUJ99_04930, partial [Bacteroidaceae bacterium]|nr:hypothetical protein [Bacteroidaceae bacterium]
MSRLVMGYWDCPVCGNKGVRGDVMNCPSCGRARGDVKFYMKNNAQDSVRNENDRGDIEYLSEEQKQNFDDNPDWYCSFCNSLNKDRAAFCSNCGATREDSESNYFDQLKKREAAAAEERRAQEAMTSGSRSSGSKSSGGGKKILGIIAAVVIALVLLVTYLNGNTTQ